MTCYKCGLELAPFETACPRCSRNTTTPKDTSLSDRTQHLVQLERCSQCRMLIFPGDTFCTSCGTPIERQTSTPSNFGSAHATDTRRWVAVGVAVSVLLIAIFIYALRHL